MRQRVSRPSRRSPDRTHPMRAAALGSGLTGALNFVLGDRFVFLGQKCPAVDHQ